MLTDHRPQAQGELSADVVLNLLWKQVEVERLYLGIQFDDTEGSVVSTMGGVCGYRSQ